MQAAASPASDPRTIITHEAFRVSPDLLGLPLATPGRRLAAIAIDGILIAILSNASGVFLGLAAAYVLFRASGRAAGGGYLRGSVRMMLRFWGAVVIFAVVVNLWGGALADVQDRPGVAAAVDSALAALDGDTLATATAAGDTLAELERELEIERESRRALARQIDRLQEEAERGPGVVAFLRRIADDLGLGFGWAGLYFTASIALWRGQTAGKRMLGIRVIRLDGKPIGWWAAFERFGGYAAGFATGLLGFAQVFWDRNRQAVHDKIAETVVVREP